jgi:hypothetical protein
MKRSINIEIGEGLFANEPVPVEIQFADHTATFLMTALTQSVVVDLEKNGVKFDAAASTEKALASSRKLFAAVVHGWEGFKANGVEIPYSNETRDRVAEVPEVAVEIINIAMQLASHRQSVEEGN